MVNVPIEYHPAIGDVISNRYLVTGDVKQIPKSWDINPKPFFDIWWVYNGPPIISGNG